MAFKLPNDTQRCTIIGRTGSGKTQAGIWQLSERSYTSMPWIVFDFKRDPLIDRIPYSIPLALGTIPKESGLYIVRPIPGEDEAVEAYLWEIWGVGNIGVFADEGAMFRHSNGFKALLTQGRSKHIPMIILNQRPVDITRFAFSEADFLQIFLLTDVRDRKTIAGYVDYDFERPLPRYYSIWYDVAEARANILRPVPNEVRILDTFRDRLGPRPEPESEPEAPNLGPALPTRKRFILI